MPNNIRPLSCLWLGLISVSLIAGCSTSGSGSGGGGGSTTPTPALASISPTSTPAGTSSVTLTASGSNFTSASQIEVAGTPAVTSFVSSSQLTATVTASQLANAASIPVAVITADQITSSVTFTVDNPAPAIVSLAPTSVAAGSTAANITLTGTGFVSGSAGSVNGSARPTAVLSSTQLVVTLSATDLAAVGTVPVVVTNPAPGGGASAPSNISVAATAANSPTLKAVGPSSLYVGSPDSPLTLSGTNFNSGCTVQVNGKTAPSSDFSATVMTSTAAASLLTSAGSFPVTVTCLGVTSNAVTVSVVNPPVPTLTSVLQAIPLNTQTTVAATGTGFTQNTVLQLNGVALATTYKSSTTLNAVIPSSAITAFGNYSITAYTPAPGGGTSASVPLTPYLALPNNSMVYNPADGLFYLSVPSSAGAPYGNSVVSVDPISGAIGTPIFVGSEPDRLALSSDGSVLWVGLDGGASVRKVNLATKSAGYSFTLGGNAGLYENPGKALALAAIPGSPDSVAVAAYRAGSFNNSLQIFDSGVPRTNSFSNYVNNPEALQIDGTRGEIYAAANGSYYVFTYSGAGLTTKTTVSSGSYGNSSNDDLQNANGRLYTDFGKVYDTESGSLLGTLYSSGTTAANGPTVADTALNKIFVLDSTTQSIYDQNQIQIFDLNAYTTSGNAIPLYGVNSSPASHLTRWGANGLAFRTSTGFFSLRSNFVNDLSTTNADLGVALAATPSTTTTGSTVSYAITTTNTGPSASTGVALSYALPSNGVITAITPSQGTCNTSGSCDLGSLSSSASATVTFSVQMLTSGTATLTANVNGSENDPSTINNSGSLSVTVTGAAYSPAPSITSLSPAAIQAGLSTDTTVTINGTNFTPNSIAILGTTALATTYVNPTQLSVVVPQATSASLGWAPVSVSTPAPGGGSTSDLPLSFFQVLTAGINHILYDPFSRKIMASVGSGSSTLTGNSIVALTPETGSFGTPVAIGSQPSNLALSDDGSLLYTILTGSESVARFNMLSQSLDFTFAVPAPQSSISPALRDLAVEPGSPNTVVLDLGSGTGIAAYDFNPSTQTAAIRGQATGPYTGSSLQFLDSANLFDFDIDTSGSTFNHFTLTGAGFTYYNYSQYTESTLNNFGRFKIRGKLAFANNGGVADPTVTPAQQLGVYPPAGAYVYSQTVEPDTSLSRVFFLGETSSSNTSGNPDGIVTYNQQTFLPLAATSLNMSTIEGGTSYSGVDFIRWGQDGLAVLSSGGHIYLLRGGVVVPAELTSNSAATLSSLSTNTIAVGTGNTTISVTGSGFIPGAGVFLNGSYRTTTYVDSTHLTACIPASDLASARTASITVNNPSATASNILSITIQ